MDAQILDYEYTVEDIYALPNGRRAELIDGVWFDLAAPRPYHQEISGFFVQKIRDHIEAHGGDCKVYPAPFAVRLEDDGKNYVEPDISVVCDPQKIDDTGCNGAPDWIIEILSPDTRSKDMTVKLTKYAESGVREYWIVDPANEKVIVYPLADILSENELANTISLYTFNDEITGYVFPDLTISGIPHQAE